MRFRGGEFSTGTMGNFQPELTGFLPRVMRPIALGPLPVVTSGELDSL